MRRFLALAIVMVFGVAGCGSSGEPGEASAATNTSAVSDQSEIVGVWTTNLKGIYVAFNADGTYGKGYSAELALASSAESPGNEWGTWTIDNGILTMSTPDGTRWCSGDVGRYEIELSDTRDEMFVTLIDDTCTKRIVDDQHGLTRHSDTAVQSPDE